MVKENEFDLKVAKKLSGLSGSAQRRGVYFDVSFRKMKSLMKVKRCYFTKVELTPANFSVDRLDNTKGYIDNNIVACDADYNKRKGALTPADVKALYTGLLVKGIV